MARVDALIQNYRASISERLGPLVRTYHPRLLTDAGNEYSKMLELSTKMTLVGHACTEIAGYEYDERRQSIGSMFGGCCFLADSFIDDFGDDATREYLDRFEVLLTKGWFEVRTDREELFYVILSRLFRERDVLQPMLRQAILLLYLAQRRDAELRLASDSFQRLSRGGQLRLLYRCARDRSGHAITVLSKLLVPDMSFSCLAHIFAAGALIMHIDDHGDCHADRRERRTTYMNRVADPVAVLRRIFVSHIERIYHGLPHNSGRDLLIAFLTRYYLTRLEKHRQQAKIAGAAWVVYE